MQGVSGVLRYACLPTGRTLFIPLNSVRSVPLYTSCATPIKAGAVPGIGNTVSSRCEERCPLSRLPPGRDVAMLLLLGALALGVGYLPLITILRTRLRTYWTV